MTKHLQHAIEPPWQEWGDFLHIFFFAWRANIEKKETCACTNKRETKYIQILFILV